MLIANNVNNRVNLPLSKFIWKTIDKGSEKKKYLLPVYLNENRPQILFQIEGNQFNMMYTLKSNKIFFYLQLKPKYIVMFLMTSGNKEVRLYEYFYLHKIFYVLRNYC